MDEQMIPALGRQLTERERAALDAFAAWDSAGQVNPGRSPEERAQFASDWAQTSRVLRAMLDEARASDGALTPEQRIRLAFQRGYEERVEYHRARLRGDDERPNPSGSIDGPLADQIDDLNRQARDSLGA